MWSAVHFSYSENQYDPTTHGFATESDAWDYVFGKMCDGCKKLREAYLADPSADSMGEDGEIFADEFPSCSAEWSIMLTVDYDAADDFADLLTAAGFKQEWEKPEEGNSFGGSNIHSRCTAWKS